MRPPPLVPAACLQTRKDSRGTADSRRPSAPSSSDGSVLRPPASPEDRGSEDKLASLAQRPAKLSLAGIRWRTLAEWWAFHDHGKVLSKPSRARGTSQGAQAGGTTAHDRRVSGTLVKAAASVVVQGQLFHGAQGGGRRGPPGLQHKHGLARPVLRAQPARDGHLDGGRTSVSLASATGVQTRLASGDTLPCQAVGPALGTGEGPDSHGLGPRGACGPQSCPQVSRPRGRNRRRP